MDSTQAYEGTVTMKDLLLAMFRNWKIIIAVNIIVALIGALYGFVIADPMYEAVVEGSMFVPAFVETKYGIYNFPTTNPAGYLALAKSDKVLDRFADETGLNADMDTLKDMVSIFSDRETGYISIRVTGYSPADAKLAVEKLAGIWIDEINTMYKETAAEQYILSINERDLINAEQKVLIQRDLEKTESMLDGLEPIIGEGVIDPAYQSLQSEIISLKLRLNDLDLTDERNNVLRTELKDRSSEALDLLKNRIYIDQEADLPDYPIAPRKLLILAVAVVFGAALGVLSAFFKAYWKNEF